jgi:N,N'-diacetyllegionaminate synthase
MTAEQTRDYPTSVPYLVAEIGVNHDGDLARAREMVASAAAAGFDAVKFQYWVVDELLAPEAPAAAYQNAESQHRLLEGLALNVSDLSELRRATADVGLDFIVTPDGVRAFQDVMTLDPDALKIGSGDADNPYLLDCAKRAGKPIIVSTGMMVGDELATLVGRLDGVGRVVVLHCVSAYPTPLAEAALSEIPRLRQMLGDSVGFSDHTIGIVAAAAAIALGAVLVEKHVTWDTTADGPDHQASLGLADAGRWVAELRDLAVAVAERRVSTDELENRVVVRKALYAARPIRAGELVQEADLQLLRPLGDGIPAGAIASVIGRAVIRDVDRGERLTWEAIRG